MAENSETLQKIATFECRGWEIIDFIPSRGWKCVGKTGGEFKDIDLTDLDWTDFDEDADI